jgi:hypothetical protein
MFMLACKLYGLPNQRSPNIRDFVNITLGELGLKINEDMFVLSDNEPNYQRQNHCEWFFWSKISKVLSKEVFLDMYR